MSNRRRARAPHAGRTPYRPPLRVLIQRRLAYPRRWSALPWPLPGLAVAAEIGHLGAAVLEWPGAPARGVFHVIVAGLLGFAAAAWTGERRPDPKWARVAAAVVLVAPVSWLAGTLVGTSPYAALPLPYAAATTLAEVALALLLLAEGVVSEATGRAAAGRTGSRPRAAARATS